MERSSTNLYFVWRYFNVFHICSYKGDEFRDVSSSHRRSKKGCQEMCHAEKSHGQELEDIYNILYIIYIIYNILHILYIIYYI